MRLAAIISPCGTWRYTLTRVWDPTLRRALFVMLNQSTADHRRDDPIRDYAENELSCPTWCLGLTKDGEPRHPLCVANDQPLVAYTGVPNGYDPPRRSDYNG